MPNQISERRLGWWWGGGGDCARNSLRRGPNTNKSGKKCPNRDMRAFLGGLPKIEESRVPTWYCDIVRVR